MHQWFEPVYSCFTQLSLPSCLPSSSAQIQPSVPPESVLIDWHQRIVSAGLALPVLKV